MEQSNTPNPGKGLGVTGFILALLALIGGFVVMVMAVASAALNGGGMGLAIGWAVFSLVATILSFMGMSKSKAAGHKPGLAMGGLIIGIIAVLYSAYICYATHVAQGLNADLGEGLDALKGWADSVNSSMSDTAH